MNGTALPDYLDSVLFFRNTSPTRGLRELMKAVCLRLSSKGGEVSPIIRLGTQYGGGSSEPPETPSRDRQGAGKFPRPAGSGQLRTP